MKLRKPLRRNDAMIARRCVEDSHGRPVTRILNVPDARSITEACWLGSVSHLSKPALCRTSIVYCAVEPGIVRQRRVSDAGFVPSHCWLTGLTSVALGAGTESHRVQ